MDKSVHVERSLDLAGWLARKSYFLFGPRQTGKTTLVRHQIPRARVYDLLDSSVGPRDLRALEALMEEGPVKRALCVSLEPRTRRVGAVTILPYRKFLDALWAGEYTV